MKEVEINNDTLNNLIDVANETGVEFDCFEGVLLDNFIFYGTENIELSENHKYMMVQARALNEWSSEHVLVVTNSYEEVENFRDLFQY